MGLLKRARTAYELGYREPRGRVTKSKVRRRRGGEYADYILETETLKEFNSNIKALSKTLGSKNVRPILAQNAERVVVPYVRGKIKRGTRDMRPYHYRTSGTSFKVAKGNMRNSFKVLTSKDGSRKWDKDHVVFIGPRAFFGKLPAAHRRKVMGTNPKNANAFYAPARESKEGDQIKPAIRAISGSYFTSNANAIKSLLR